MIQFTTQTTVILHKLPHNTINYISYHDTKLTCDTIYDTSHHTTVIQSQLKYYDASYNKIQ